MNTRFNDYIARKHVGYGSLFNDEELAEQFVPYFNSGERIKVKTQFGEIKFGTVGITAGWRPSFLLMHSIRCIGSSTLLSHTDIILAVKRGNKYEPIP